MSRSSEETKASNNNNDNKVKHNLDLILYKHNKNANRRISFLNLLLCIHLFSHANFSTQEKRSPPFKTILQENSRQENIHTKRNKKNTPAVNTAHPPFTSCKNFEVDPLPNPLLQNKYRYSIYSLLYYFMGKWERDSEY